MHGTTVATNALLTGEGARVGLVVTDGYRQILHLARSWVPGGLGAWINFDKSAPLAPLKWTIEAKERMGADGSVVEALNEAALRSALQGLRSANLEAITICFINAYVNAAHEERARAIVEEELPGLAVSTSSETVPEIQEYERAITTVTNSFVKPAVFRYVHNLKASLAKELGEVDLRILRSDGGLATADFAADYPVNLLMSGPAGGVSGAIWVAKRAGFPNIITFDMGGTSTDVALVQNSVAQVRRETVVGDVSVRASSVDVRTVGAGGGSIAHVPELTGALRVGPRSAGSVPGPAAYDKGGKEPTVTDANVVLGYLPSRARLGGAMAIRRDLAEDAVGRVASAMGLSIQDAAEGIIRIVNENMFGALRLVSIEQGYDPRDFALMAFGGAGPLHANALGILLGSWPVIIPPGPGVLCAAGDATTALRDEAARTFIKLFSATDAAAVADIMADLKERALETLERAGVPAGEQRLIYQADVRYSGQANELTIEFDAEELKSKGFQAIAQRFDALHAQLFTFSLEIEKEFVNLRVIAEGAPADVGASALDQGNGDPQHARIGDEEMFFDGRAWTAVIYNRAALKKGDRISGPAILTQMDTTSVILPGHVGEVDAVGCVLIRPVDHA
jgi:N-methylhydantoinase A